MNEITRSQYETVQSRIAEPRRFIQVIAGPRQVGKTTLVNQVLRKCDIPFSQEIADSISPRDTDWIGRVWQSARTKMKMRQQPVHLLVIDEIQKIDNWSEAVKREWDQDSRDGLDLRVVLLGSSRLLLRKGLTESLAGRFELIRVPHWSYSEMREAFDVSLDEYIYFGGYPGAAPFIRTPRRWKRYVQESLVAPTIEKDVIMTATIYKPALMQQLFQLGCSYSAEMLSLTKMLGQMQDAGNVTTLANYLALLDQSNLLCGLQKYAKDTARRYTSVPKYQVYNNALLTAFKGRTFEKDRIDTSAWGRWVESAVGAHLVNLRDELGFRLNYWNNGRDEVDFVLSTSSSCIAIEVKSGRRGMNSGIPAFKKAFSPDLTLVVGTGGLTLEEFFTADLGRLL